MTDLIIPSTNDIYKKTLSIDNILSSYLSNNTESFCKFYYVQLEDSFNTNYYIINIRIVLDKIYLYLHDIKLNCNTLIHTFEPNNNIKQINKYIQMSPDLKIFSIPDKEYLYFFKVDSLIKYKQLDQFDFDIKFNMLSNTLLSTSSNSSLDTFSELSLSNILKCVLYANKYIFIDTNKSNVKNIMIFDFLKKKIKFINTNFEPNIKITLNSNGNYMLLYNNVNVYIIDNVNYKKQIIPFNDSHNIVSTSLSPNGKIIVFLTDDGLLKIFINNIDNYKQVIFNVRKHIKSINFKMYLYDYSNILLNNEIYSELYLLVLFDMSFHKLHIWSMLICNNDEIILSEPKEITFNIKSKINSLNVHDCIFIYKYTDFVDIYDIKKYFLNILINAILDAIKLLIRNKIKIKTNNTINTNFKIITTDREINIITNTWLKEICNFDLNLTNFKELEYDILTYNEKRLTTIEIFLTIFKDHYKISDMIKELNNEIGQTKKVNLIINGLFQIKSKLLEQNFLLENIQSELTYYFEYLIIKFVLNYYENKKTYTMQILINYLIKLFKKLTKVKSRLTFVELCKITLGIDLTKYI